MADLDVPLITGFLQHLESERGNGVTTRNARPHEQLLGLSGIIDD